MRKLFYLMVLLLSTSVAFSQSPQQISYQAVVRDASNALVTNAQIGVQINITYVDSVIYSEQQTVKTNQNGLFSLTIGTGTIISGNFTTIDWSKGNYFIKTKIDPKGGTNYTLIGSSKLNSVPYSLYAANGLPSGTNKGDLLFWDGNKWTKLPIGNEGSSLTVCGGALHWGPCTVSNLPVVKNIIVTRSYNRIPAFISATIASNGGSTITKRGFCWSLKPNPTIQNDSSNSVPFSTPPVTDTGAYMTTFPSLPTADTFFFRAYAINSNGIAYSEQVPLSRASAQAFSAPTVNSISVTLPYFYNPTMHGGPSTGHTIGQVVSNGGSKILSMGFCWSLTPNPTLSDSHSVTTKFADTTSTADTGRFDIGSNSSLLDSAGTFYFRAYATNAFGTSYGEIIMVVGKRSAMHAPSVTSDLVVLSPAGKPLNAYGTITDNGLVGIRERGFCWSTSPNPTMADKFDTANYRKYPNSDTGYYGVKLDSSKFLPNTTYYFRSYAIGYTLSYGNQLTIKTGSGVTPKFTLGQSYGGGNIFYLDSTGQHGLIAATSDASSAIQWYNGGYIATGAVNLGIGGGQENTNTIIRTQSTGSYAAYISTQSNNGYNDWFLPSKAELELMYINLHAKGLGNFVGNFYWSSSESNAYEAWVHDFGQNSKFGYYKNNQARVRAIRKF